MKVKALDISVIQIPVRNVEQSVTWYKETLGLQFTFEYSQGDSEAWMNVNGGIGFGLVKCDGDTPNLHFYNSRGELNPMLTFKVDNIQDVYSTMKNKGIEVSEMIYKEGGGYSYSCTDLNGHSLTIWGGWPKE